MEELKQSVRMRRQGKKSKWILFLLIGILTLGLVGGCVWTYVLHTNEYLVDLTIFGDETVVLEYGATYDEPGAKAVGYGTLLHKDPQELQVQVDSKVDVSEPGDYEVIYSAEFEGTEATVSRKVQVVDTVAPEITLITDPEHFTFPNQPYEEEGYAASDNYDGDLTDQVSAVEKDGKVIYTVTDSSGNQTSVEREIRYDDPVAPELTLKGESTVTITEGNKWKEPGYTATDNVDGDLTEKVTVIGTVDYNKPGTYKLTYEVKDNYQNTAKAERTVTVKAKPQPQPNTQGGSTQGGSTQDTNSSTSQGKVIYLTFDDGPSKYTPKLLDILAKYNVKATFFVCGTGKVDLLDDIANGGHTLALHSKTHKYESIYASESAFYNDLYAIQDIVEKYSGVKSFITRFPGGSSNSISKKICPGIMTSLTQSMPTKGFTYFDWNIDSKDAGGASTASEVANNVINGISKSKRKSLVVLQHDIKGYSVDAVEQIIQWGLANGCTFKALTESSPVCHHNVNN